MFLISISMWHVSILFYSGRGVNHVECTCLFRAGFFFFGFVLFSFNFLSDCTLLLKLPDKLKAVNSRKSARFRCNINLSTGVKK